MNYWNQTPLFRLLPAFILGIFAGIFWMYILPFKLIALSALPVCILLCQGLFPKKFFSYGSRWTFGLCSHSIVFLFAWLITELNTEIYSANHFSKIENTSEYLAYFNSSKQEKSKSYKSTIEVIAVKSSEKWIPVKGQCLVYISKDSLSEKLSYGDLISFSEKPNEVKPAANPSQFNYKQWLSYNQVYHDLFLHSSSWKLIAHHHGNFIVEESITMRDKLLNIFKDNGIKGDDYAVVSALLLGDTDEIDPEIMNAYAASGALHVLSVSGLHVGIIYIAFSAVLFFLNRNKTTKIIKAGILILFLWYYALLTGLSPAVLRSAAMLSYIIIGKSLGRYTNMYNTLAASAMTLFCFQPHLLMQVGFQLSYLAVLGIVFLYKKIHALFDPSTWIGKQIWGLTAVSIAAQLATFPLGLLYFHQFPNYFLVSNLVVIPISTVILYGGIFLFVISPFTGIAKWVGLILGKTVHLLNWSVITIEHLPYSLLQGISISIFETYLIYMSILMLILYFMYKQTRYVYVMMTTIVIIFSIHIIDFFSVSKQQQFVVYDIPKASAIQLIDGKGGLFIADSSLVNNKSAMLFCILHYWWDCGLDDKRLKTILTANEKNENVSTDKFILQKNFLLINNSRILILNDSTLLNKSISVDIDYLVLSKNLKIHLSELQQKFHFKQLIIDSSNSLTHVERWLKEGEKLKIDCYSVLHNGAYIKIFN